MVDFFEAFFFIINLQKEKTNILTLLITPIVSSNRATMHKSATMTPNLPESPQSATTPGRLTLVNRKFELGSWCHFRMLKLSQNNKGQLRKRHNFWWASQKKNMKFFFDLMKFLLKPNYFQRQCSLSP